VAIHTVFDTVMPDQHSESDPKQHVQKKRRDDHSSGGVAYRLCPNGKGYQIALIATRNWRRWQLPKGSVEPDETSEETAIREVEEEVGLHTAPDKFLHSIDYWYWDTYRRTTPELVHKTVDFYLLRVVSGTLSDSSHEVDGVGWFSFEQALKKLTFQGEVEVVRAAQDALNHRATENG
jgi:8-oxo-dGTP pyrophosphatase MutT (NUDIX family)